MMDAAFICRAEYNQVKVCQHLSSNMMGVEHYFSMFYSLIVYNF